MTGLLGLINKYKFFEDFFYNVSICDFLLIDDYMKLMNLLINEDISLHNDIHVYRNNFLGFSNDVHYVFICFKVNCYCQDLVIGSDSSINKIVISDSSKDIYDLVDIRYDLKNELSKMFEEYGECFRGDD